MADVKDVRVRIAPSPTGDPHVGLAYMTLFNYVFAKKHGGKLILRIEDTDQVRAKASSQEQICESLKWLGLQWDEGPGAGGDYGPYLQSERKQIHIDHALKLVEKEKAYHCFCTPERLTTLREEQKARKENPGYDRKCRELDANEIKEKLASGLTHVIRLKTPITGRTVIVDAIRGDVEFDNERVDDQVLIKSDGFPTYHLANVVDDHLMKISHVMRAEEWISSTPKHVILYEAFGWDLPVFVHLPLLRNSNKSKISKRKNPVSLSYYRRKGILPAAMLNFLGLMGWSFGDDIEVFSVEQMMERFELKNIHLGGPVFDLDKLAWINQTYMHKMTPDDIVEHLRTEVFSVEYLKKLQPLALERMNAFEQFVDKNDFFFNGALDYSQVTIVPKGKEKSDMNKMVKSLIEKLDELYVWTAEEIQSVMDNHRKEIDWKPKDYYMPVRLMATGRKDSPPLAESLEVIGREIVRFRLRDSLKSSDIKQ